MGYALHRAKLAVVVAVSSLSLITVAAVQAQVGGPGGPGGGMGRGGVGGGFALLQVDAVQKELTLTDEQKSSIAKLEEELRDLPREERMAKAGETRQRVEAILQPEQKERLEQIGLQMAGGRALTWPEIAKQLGLTDDQRDKLDELYPPPGGFGTPSAPPGGGGGPAGGAAGRGAGNGARGAGGGGGQGGNFRAMREEMNAKAMEILTPEQRTQFEQMQGKKIDIDPSQLFRGGRGQGGQGAKGRPDA